jgi:hypothetical protein
MMCTGHLIYSSRRTIKTGEDLQRTELAIIDAKPDVVGDMVEGAVLEIEIRESDVVLKFDLNETRELIEACQDILSRYDDAERT